MIESMETVLLLGRSGTGKTICIANKIRSGLSRTIAVVQMHVWLSFVRFCICVLNSLNGVAESFCENFR